MTTGVPGPKVTVGVMVYNEEKYLAGTLDSILKQAFPDCEILISDNASDDRTGAIALEYAKRDTRIRYLRQPRNVGAILNYHNLVRNARGEYFVLAGAHDLWSENFLDELAGALDRDSGAVIATGRTVMLDGDGAVLDDRMPALDTSGLGTVARFNIVLWGNQNAMYAMHRMNVLRYCETNLQIIGNGAVLLGEMAIRGSFVVVPNVTWYRRQVRSETREERFSRYCEVLFPHPRVRLLPLWRMPWAFFASILRAEVRPSVRMALLLSGFGVFLRYGPAFLDDLKSLLRRIVRGKL